MWSLLDSLDWLVPQVQSVEDTEHAATLAAEAVIADILSHHCADHVDSAEAAKGQGFPQGHCATALQELRSCEHASRSANSSVQHATSVEIMRL